MRIAVPLLLISLFGVIAADETAVDPTFTTPMDLHSWRDRPADFLVELNDHLPPHQRLAWYVDANTNGSVYPGPVLDFEQATIPAMLDAYCTATGLAWSRRDRAVWIHRRPGTDEANLVQTVLAADAAVRKPAMASALSQQDPARMAALLQALASSDDAVRQDAWRYLATALGASERAFYQQHQMILDIYVGLQPHFYQPKAMIGSYGKEVYAPWVWAYVLLGDPANVAVLTQAIRTRSAQQLADDLPLLILTSTALLDAAKAALELRKNKAEGFGGWEVNWVKGKAGSIIDWIDARKAGTWPAGPDYAARAAEARGMVIGGAKLEAMQTALAEANKALIPLTEQVERLKRDDPKNKEARKVADNAVKAAQSKIEGINKQMKDRDKANLTAINRLANGFGPAAVHLAEIASETVTDLAVRQMALMKLDLFRNPEVVPILARILNEDKQPILRDLAARALGRVRALPAIAVLKQALADQGDRFLRQGGAIGLALSRHPDGGQLIAALVETCQGSDRSEERQYLLQVLGLCRDPDANAHLTEIAFKGTVVQDRVAATLGLSLVPTDAAQAVLVKLINDEAESVNLRDAAVQGLTPQDGEQARRMLPILLDALPAQRNTDLGIKMVDAIWLGTKYLSSGTPLKARVAEVCVGIFNNEQIPTMVRTRVLNVFKNTDNTPAILEALKQAQATAKNPVMKQFITNAVSNVEKGLAVTGDGN